MFSLDAYFELARVDVNKAKELGVVHKIIGEHFC